MPRLFPIIRNAPVKGAYFRGDMAKAACAQAEPGDSVELKLDPTNEHDEYCVEVHNAAGVFMGFVPKEISAVFHLLETVDITILAEVTGRDKGSQKWPLITAAAVLED